MKRHLRPGEVHPLRHRFKVVHRLPALDLDDRVVDRDEERSALLGDDAVDELHQAPRVDNSEIHGALRFDEPSSECFMIPVAVVEPCQALNTTLRVQPKSSCAT